MAQADNFDLKNKTPLIGQLASQGGQVWRDRIRMWSGHQKVCLTPTDKPVAEALLAAP